LRHDAAATAFSAAQSFDELGHWGARLDPKANEIPLGDDAAVLTGQAPDHDHPAWTRNRFIEPRFRDPRGLLWPLTSGTGGRPSVFPQLIRSGLDSMLALSDDQLAVVVTAVGKLPTGKRGVFLERVVARLSFSPRFTAAEFADAVHLTLCGLIQEKSAA
jgi:hypothetical protein